MLCFPFNLTPSKAGGVPSCANVAKVDLTHAAPPPQASRLISGADFLVDKEPS